MNNTILIVDDVMINIDMLANILKDGYAIMAAASGEKAIKILSRKTPDLVLLDLSMPEIDGFGVLRFMKENKGLADIPVIFITGERDEYAEEKGLALGAVDYIKKPYNASVVKFKVRNHLELKAYRDNLEALIRERTGQLEERTRQLATSHEAIIMGMSLMSESHDSITGEHIERIKAFTDILTSKMTELYPDIITADMAHQIVLFSPLHDVGKVSIPDHILKKEGALTSEEFDIMKMHTLNAAKLLRKTESFFAGNKGVNLNVAIEIAENHHERYDGTGYPHGISGDEIPLSARIVALADVYDALRSQRSYKRAFSHMEAFNTILSGGGKTAPEHFDPKVLNVFYIMHKEFEKVYRP